MRRRMKKETDREARLKIVFENRPLERKGIFGLRSVLSLFAPHTSPAHSDPRTSHSPRFSLLFC
jgi:hypothetical protein